MRCDSARQTSALLGIDGGAFEMSHRNVPPAFAECGFVEVTPVHPIRPHRPWSRGTHEEGGAHIQISSRNRLARSRTALRMVELAGARTVLVVPMLKDDDTAWRDRHLPTGGTAIHRQSKLS